MVRPLFVAGASRSGTTALMEYLNEIEEVMVCRERYKHIPEKIDPSLLTFERILDYEPMQSGGETNIPREYHVDLLARKDPAKLKWIGDKQPAHPRRFKAIADNNPGAHFIITHRPIEEVVESFEDRAKNLEDPWIGVKDGLKMDVAAWNSALRGTREYLENDPEPNGLILACHDFFYRNEKCAPLLSRFLEMDFADETLETWAKTSREFEGRRREKEPMTEEKAAYIEEHKDHEAEAWVLDRIERQWDEPRLYKRTVGGGAARRRLAAALMKRLERPRQEEDGKQRLMEGISAEREKNAALGQHIQNLSAHVNSVESSRSWKLLNGVNRVCVRLRSAVSGRMARR